MTTPVLELLGIDRTYRTAAGALQVLQGTDLRVSAGELVGLVGPSGSGKSTLLHTAGLLERPEGGSIFLMELTASNSMTVAGQGSDAAR